MQVSFIKLNMQMSVLADGETITILDTLLISNFTYERLMKDV